VGGRSAGVKIDAFRLYKKGSTPPTGSGISSIKKPQMAFSESTPLSGYVYTHEGRKVLSFKDKSVSQLKKDLKSGMYILNTSIAGKVMAQKIMVH
jgi:hypothetical protein